MISDTIKKNIKKKLKERGSNTTNFCKELGMNKNYINQITDGITLSRLKMIANSLDCLVSDLVKE